MALFSKVRVGPAQIIFALLLFLQPGAKSSEVVLDKSSALPVSTTNIGQWRWQLGADRTSFKMAVPQPFVSAVYLEGLQRTYPSSRFSEAGLLLGGNLTPSSQGAELVVEWSENTQQFSDGRFVLPTAKEEGFSARANTMVWNVRPTRWGMFQMEGFLRPGPALAGMEVWVGGLKLPQAIGDIAQSAEWKTVVLGKVYLSDTAPFTVSCHIPDHIRRSAPEKWLAALTLRPAPEGDVISQRQDGEVVLQARDATTHGLMMRYEPQTNKNCLGYWVNPNDWAEWEFTLATAGEYEVELWQGCGKGQGGSEIIVEIGDRKFPMVVEETGHFQNFISRKAGKVRFSEPGKYRLTVKPTRKKAAAVMDIQKIMLKPVTGAAK